MPTIEVTFIALAVAMDAFSLSVSVGMSSLSKIKLGGFALLVGLFHILMTYLGLKSGQLVSGFIGESAVYVGGGILLILGLKMIREEAEERDQGSFADLKGLSFILLPLTVSIDALTVGFSLGAVGMPSLLVALFFGFISSLLAIAGLLLGDLVGRFLKHSGLLGGIILLLLGLKMALGF